MNNAILRVLAMQIQMKTPLLIRCWIFIHNLRFKFVILRLGIIFFIKYS